MAGLMPLAEMTHRVRFPVDHMEQGLGQRPIPAGVHGRKDLIDVRDVPDVGAGTEQTVGGAKVELHRCQGYAVVGVDQ